MPGATDYSKFEKMSFDEDDANDKESSEPAKPLMDSNRHREQVEKDNEVYEHFKQLFKTHLKKEYPLTLRKLLARFVAVQHPDEGQQTNIYRYNDIMGLVGQRQEELSDRACIKALVELHKKVGESAPQPADKSNEVRDPAALADMKIIMEAMNTLEAMQSHPPPAALFEKLASPSTGDSARDLYTKYYKKEFGKRAMLRSMFGDEVFGQFEEDEAKREQKDGKGGSGFLGIDSETWGMIGTLCSMLLMLALTGWFAFWALSKVKGDSTPDFSRGAAREPELAPASPASASYDEWDRDEL